MVLLVLVKNRFPCSICPTFIPFPIYHKRQLMRYSMGSFLNMIIALGATGETISSCKYATDDDDDGCNDTRARTKHEDSNQSEDQHRSHTSYCEGEFGQPDCDYYNPWSYNLFCEDEDSDSQYNGDETSSTYGHHMDDVGLFRGILGSFPCLRQYVEINQ
ncbi:hypothetical protein ES332_A04G109600v1 [Gossypium tomentosum]|uniref:Uncharacterized protein n=1 Tax=Gossypium tomentosum TaxID=34277 RepID=A0A5D2QWV7_GOSTO|nr:hypothetical protein ES332_A04G109600v1 [Gossypium tomentosum]